MLPTPATLSRAEARASFVIEDRSHRASPAPPWLRLLLSAALPASAVGLTLVSRPLLDQARFFLPLAGIALAAWSGVSFGLVATAVGTLLVSWFFIEPVGSLVPGTLEQLLLLGIFLVAALVIVRVASKLRRASAIKVLAAAQTSEIARAQSIIESSDDAIISKTLDGVIQSWNAGAAALFGYAAQEVIGRNVTLIIPEDRFAEEEGIRARIRGGEHVGHYETVRLHRDGRRIPVSLSVSPVRAPDGEIVAAATIIRDITLRHEAEHDERLIAAAGDNLAQRLDPAQTLRTLVRLIVPAIGEWAVIDVSEDGHVRRAAFAHADPEKEVLLARMSERYPPDGARPTLARTVISTGRAELVPDVTDEMIDRVSRDAEHAAMVRALGMRSYIVAPMQARGRLIGVIAIASATRPFTDRELRLAQELARRAALAADNAQLYQAAINASEAKSKFLATMSHELRTPLNAIAGYAQLLEMGLRGPLTPDQREDLARIQRSQRHLLGLIEDILSFARIETGRIELNVVPVDVVPLLSDVIDIIGPQARDKNVALERREIPPSLRVFADRDRLRQVLINLASNGVKFTDRGGTVTFGITPGEGTVELRVKDTGIGIAPDKLDQIFQPFVQVGRSLNAPRSGTGLGLAISRELSRLMGGDLLVSSEPGLGSEFVVRLPRAPDEEPELQGSAASRAAGNDAA